MNIYLTPEHDYLAFTTSHTGKESGFRIFDIMLGLSLHGRSFEVITAHSHPLLLPHQIAQSRFLEILYSFLFRCYSNIFTKGISLRIISVILGTT